MRKILLMCHILVGQNSEYSAKKPNELSKCCELRIAIIFFLIMFKYRMFRSRNFLFSGFSSNICAHNPDRWRSLLSVVCVSPVWHSTSQYCTDLNRNDDRITLLYAPSQFTGPRSARARISPPNTKSLSQ